MPDDQDLPAQLPPPTHRYMVIYELDNEPDVVMAEFLKRVMAGSTVVGGVARSDHGVPHRVGAARRTRAGGALVGELLAGIHAQRACRRFDPDGKVPDSDVEQILAARGARAERGEHPALDVHRGPTTRATAPLLAAWWTETWNAGGGDFVRQSVEDKVLVADLEFGFSKGGFAAAPVVVVVCADTDRVAARSTHRRRSTRPCRTCCSPTSVMAHV